MKLNVLLNLRAADEVDQTAIAYLLSAVVNSWQNTTVEADTSEVSDV